MSDEQQSRGTDEYEEIDNSLIYCAIVVPFRPHVRVPIHPPEMRIGSLDQPTLRVRLNEAQLLAIISDATKALDSMRQRRGAMQP